jgi:hypothetical protein
MSPVGSPRQHLGLALLSGLGLAYVVWIVSPLVSWSSPLLEGIVGVVLGLYLGSHPAAHAIDLLFLQRTGRRPASPARQAAWLALNALALLVSLLVIALGATRFAAVPTTP